ncbi:DUF4282 domain-containing protein [Microbacterium fluvii]|uniref:DUF4282 domain-containing protein n=1 Tax=Microbacterium fluvii TaxID=415215 RepID=A0ABW2H9A1_9MICO|nr:DUF4282 domain-containing protein [Microbacterium fluvii]MCU4671548.1 DUF4282 domain-containing protein [Microbacterium fluvii]
MSDTTPTPPPLPPRSAEEAARAAQAPTAPTADIDDTGVPAALADDALEVGRGFFAALFDVSFRTFITRRLASVFYIVGLAVIAIGFIVYFVTGIVNAIGLLWYNVGGGISLIVSTVILVPLITFLAIIVLRFVIEAVVALIAIAENTQRTADNTRD